MTTDYGFLPFRFERFDSGIIMTNEVGEYYFMPTTQFDDILAKREIVNREILRDLKSKDFIYYDKKDLLISVERLAAKIRTKKRFLENFTTLHMMVITLRCNHRCDYCQVSSADTEEHKYDMDKETVEKIVDVIFQSPSKSIKIEFQGGEPLLNWAAIVHTVEYAKKKEKYSTKKVEFVICTNLVSIDSEKLNFLRDNSIAISTSLDGPKSLHDAHRKLRSGLSSYDQFIEKLTLSREILGHDSVSALMTITSSSFSKLKDIIDHYFDLGFDGLFFRALNPYGFAHEDKSTLGYNVNEFIENYKIGLDYIIKKNIDTGVLFPEYFTTLLLARILTPYSTGFVDLQSPSGAGISGAIYDYNGDVYPADEARMLSRMGDQYFKMGNVYLNSYLYIFGGSVIKNLVKKSCLEILPVCADCVYLPYCGADPVRNYLEYGDIIGKRPGSDFCIKNKAIITYLFELLQSADENVTSVFWSWLTRQNLKDIHNG